jgi:hypothetical protein
VNSNDFHGGTEIEVRSDVKSCLRRWRQRLLLQRLLSTIAACAVLLVIGRLLATAPVVMLQQVLALCLAAFILLWLSPSWQRLSHGSFLQHLNRRFPDFEESAQLLIRDTPGLTPLQRLQRQRAQAVYRQNLARVERWLPPFGYRPALGVVVICLLLAPFTDQLASLTGRFLSKNLANPALDSLPVSAMSIDNVAVRIEPPAYTGLAVIQSDQLDLEVPEGSRVEWNLSFDTKGDEFALNLTDERQIKLSPVDDGTLFAAASIDKTSLYRIQSLNSSGGQDLAGVYSLVVTPDRAPDIRIIEPEVTALEIPESGPARFTSRALVKDDYGVQTVDILASVAKGSGEGVKFRDQSLRFDNSVETDRGLVYQKEWDLQALGMEPGDEVYFTVMATDNRVPKANTGRSATLIVRWLDDRQSGLAADGLGIDFVPEFFKSQRQIIIDTEQLLEDEARIPAEAFRNTSFEIGNAQASLKEKYGQYLGDEFGEGPAVPSAMPGDDHDQHEDGHGPETGAAPKADLNSIADIVRLFGHDHGDPEIGPITRRNPVALMKRAVSEMWQAERHLLQAQPALALPFEYEAYKYLKLARQADRIYVKRLGFEPPPVSEERRLTGKRDDVLSYRLPVPEQGQGFKIAGEQLNQAVLKNVFQTLTQYSPAAILSADERGALSRLSRVLTGLSQQQATLIRHAATLEKLAQAGRLNLNDCESCIEDLKTTLWNLIDEDAGQLHQRNAAWYADDGLIQSYRQLRNTGSDGVAATPPGGPR